MGSYKKDIFLMIPLADLIHIYEFKPYQVQLQLLKDLILGIDNYSKNDFNKNNLIKKIPNPEIIYNDGNNIVYGAGKLY